MKKIVLEADNSSIPAAIDFIQNELKNLNVAKKKIIKNLLISEEIISQLIANADENSRISVAVRSRLGYISIKLSSAGKSFELSNSSLGIDDLDSDSPEVELAIRSLILRAYSNDISLHNNRGVNTVTIQVNSGELYHFVSSLFALAGGTAVGLLLRFMPGNMLSWISANIFGTVSEMFFNAIQMIMIPVVFCSIMVSVARFGDLNAFGKVNSKILALYGITSVIAILLAYLVFSLFPCVNVSLSSVLMAFDAQEANVASITATIRDTLTGMIPSNIITALSGKNMLGVILVSVLLGISAAALEAKAAPIISTLELLEDLFGKLTQIIMGFMPAAVFCAMADMMITLGTATLLSMLSWLALIMMTHLIMCSVYGLLILILAHENPIHFYRGFFPAMLTALTVNSSSAAMPVSMDCCEKRLGISRKIYSFSIPLGASINADGSCIYMVISALFLAKIFNVELTGSMIISLFISVLLISIGAPNLPGMALVSIAILLPQLGIPAEALVLIMGLSNFADMSSTLANVTGDAAVSVIVAKSEKQLNRELYRQS